MTSSNLLVKILGAKMRHYATWKEEHCRVQFRQGACDFAGLVIGDRVPVAAKGASNQSLSCIRPKEKCYRSSEKRVFMAVKVTFRVGFKLGKFSSSLNFVRRSSPSWIKSLTRWSSIKAVVHSEEDNSVVVSSNSGRFAWWPLNCCIFMHRIALENFHSKLGTFDRVCVRT